MQVNDGEADEPFKYLLAKSTLSNTRSSVRRNFILEWLADNEGQAYWEVEDLSLLYLEEKPSPYLQWISLRTFYGHPCISKSS